MTVAATTRRAGPFIGNGITTAFPFTFKVFATSDLVVTQLDTATLVETVLAETTDYTVTLNGDQDNNPGGTVTKNSVLASGKNLVLTSNVPQTQTAIITNGGGFFPSVFNTLLDKLTVLVQQNSETLSRAITFQKTSGLTGSSVAPIANGVLRWKADATGLYTETFAAFCADVGIQVDPSTYASAVAAAQATSAQRASNLSDLASAPTALTNLGGTTVGKALFQAASQAAALLAMGVTLGTSAGNVPQLDGSARLPPVDGSQLTNIPASNVNITNYGDASDGTVTVSSGTTTLSRDMFYNNLTVSGTGKINLNGWRIFVYDTLDITAAGAQALYNNGGDGGAASTFNGGAAGATAPGNTVGAGAAAVAGANGSAAGSGVAGTSGNAGGNGGAAGATGTGGGSGGAATTGGAVTAAVLHRATPVLTTSEISATYIKGGASGGSGSAGQGAGGANTGGAGGGSGAGGGVVCIYARKINRGGSTAAGAIQAKGGTGGTASTQASAGGGSGGAGGGGGWVYIICDTLLGSTAANAVDVSGGGGGAGANTNGGLGNGGYGGGTGAGGRFTLGQTTVGSYADTLSGAAIKAPVAPTGATAGGSQAANAAQFSL